MGDPLSQLDDLFLCYNNRNACKGGVVCPNIKNSLMNYTNIHNLYGPYHNPK